MEKTISVVEAADLLGIAPEIVIRYAGWEILKKGEKIGTVIYDQETFSFIRKNSKWVSDLWSRNKKTLDDLHVQYRQLEQEREDVVDRYVNTASDSFRELLNVLFEESKGLSRIEYRIFQLWMMKGKSYEEISKEVLNLTPEEICNIVHSVTEKLKDKAKKKRESVQTLNKKVNELASELSVKEEYIRKLEKENERLVGRVNELTTTLGLPDEVINTPSKEECLYSMKIEETGFPSRAITALKRIEINTLGDLCKRMTWSDLFDVKGLGDDSLYKIEERLKKLDLRLNN